MSTEFVIFAFVFTLKSRHFSALGVAGFSSLFPSIFRPFRNAPKCLLRRSPFPSLLLVGAQLFRQQECTLPHSCLRLNSRLLSTAPLSCPYPLLKIHNKATFDCLSILTLICKLGFATKGIISCTISQNAYCAYSQLLQSFKAFAHTPCNTLILITIPQLFTLLPSVLLTIFC